MYLYIRKDIYFHATPFKTFFLQVRQISRRSTHKYTQPYSVIFKWLSSPLSWCLMYAKYLRILYPALYKYYNRITSGVRMLEHKNTPHFPLYLSWSIHPEGNILLTRFHASLKIFPRWKPSNAKENNTRINNNNKTL